MLRTQPSLETTEDIKDFFVQTSNFYIQNNGKQQHKNILDRFYVNLSCHFKYSFLVIHWYNVCVNMLRLFINV